MKLSGFSFSFSNTNLSSHTFANMYPRFYRAAKEGQLRTLRVHIQLKSNKNIPLHVVAYFKVSRECNEEILSTYEYLLFEVNSDENFALHIPVRNGKFVVGSTI